MATHDHLLGGRVTMEHVLRRALGWLMGLATGIGLVAFFGTAQGSAQAPAPPGDVVGVGPYIHIVSDLNRSLDFYEPLLGLEPTTRGAYGTNEPVAAMYDIAGGRLRTATLSVPNSDLRLEFIDWESNRSSRVEARIYDSGVPCVILQVRDIDLALQIVTAHGGTILTPDRIVHFAGSPRFSPSRLSIVRDPDGYFIELVDPEPPPRAAEPGNVLSGAFRYTATQANDAARFYQRAFGFDITPAGDFNNDDVLGAMTGLGTAVTRFARSTVPGSRLDLEFAEYTVADARSIEQVLPQLSSSMLRLMVRNVDDAHAKARAAGATVVPGNERVHTLSDGRRMIVLADPHGLLLQLAEAR